MTLPSAMAKNSSCCTGGERCGHQRDFASSFQAERPTGISFTSLIVSIRTALLPDFRQFRVKTQRLADFYCAFSIVVNLIGTFLLDSDGEDLLGTVPFECCSFKNSPQAGSTMISFGLPGHSDAVPGLLGAPAQGGGTGDFIVRGWLRGGAGPPHWPDAPATGPSIDSTDEAGGVVSPAGSQGSRCLFDADPDTTPGRCRCSGCLLAASAGSPLRPAPPAAPASASGHGIATTPRDFFPGLPSAAPEAKSSGPLSTHGAGAIISNLPCSRKGGGTRGATALHLAPASGHRCRLFKPVQHLEPDQISVGQSVRVSGAAASGHTANNVAGVVTDIQGYHCPYRVHMPHGQHRWFPLNAIFSCNCALLVRDPDDDHHDPRFFAVFGEDPEAGVFPADDWVRPYSRCACLEQVSAQQLGVRAANLQKRFPDIKRSDIVSWLLDEQGHAGKVAARARCLPAQEPVSTASSTFPVPSADASGVELNAAAEDAGGAQSRQTRLQLSLDDLLTEPSKDDSSALRMPLDFSTGIIEELFVPSVHPLLSLDPADWGDLHISTVYALGHIERGDPGSVIRLHIYTDGSCKYLPDDFKSAWAIVVVGELPSGDFCLLGVLGGPTVTDSGSSAYIGADAQSAADSEASAIVAALRFACQHYCTSAKLYYDALIIGRSIQGVGSWTSCARLKNLGRAIALTLQTRASLAWTHVKAHEGDPWNELADAAAKHVNTGATVGHPLPPLHCSWLSSSDILSFGWLAVLPPTEREAHGYPRIEDGHVLFDVPASSPDFDRIFLSMDHSPSDEVQDVSCVWTFASCNVRTTNDSKTFVGKCRAIRDQFEAKRFLAIGIQEGRSPAPNLVASANYFRIIPEFQSWQLKSDVELWLARSLPWGYIGNTPVSLQERDFTIFRFSDRHLIVSIRSSFARFDFVVTHGPNVWGNNPEDVKIAVKFWNLVRADLRARPRPWFPLVFLGDINVRLGSALSASVGQYAAGHQNEVGDVIHAILLEFGVVLPSTFERWHSGQDHTWTNSKGVTSRIDFVGIPREWAEGITSSKVVCN